MSRYAWFWTAWLVAGAAYEVWAVWGRKAPGDTFSEWTAHVLRTGTTAGFALLMALMWGLALWFPRHTRRFDKREQPQMFSVPTSFYEQTPTKAPGSVRADHRE